MTFGFRTVSRRLKIKLLDDPAQPGGDGRTQASREWILPVGKGWLPPLGRCPGLGRGMGSLKLCRLVTQVESWHGAL